MRLPYLLRCHKMSATTMKFHEARYAAARCRGHRRRHGLPLNGIRVLDFGHIVAGPFSVRMLADLGADVVKIETSTRQGRTGARRGRPPSGGSGRTPHLAQINRNRRSIDLNLKTEQGRAVARALIATADVLVENFTSGVMDRLGLGYKISAAQSAADLYEHVGLRPYGPRQGWTGMNVTLQACSGLMLATGAAGTRRSAFPIPGTTISAGCMPRSRSSTRCQSGARPARAAISTSRNSNAASRCSAACSSPVRSRRAAGPARQPLETAAPQGCYRCAGEDEWCAISVQTTRNGARSSPCSRGALRTPTSMARRARSITTRSMPRSKLGPARWPVRGRSTTQARGIPAAAMRRGNELTGVEEWQLSEAAPRREARHKVVGVPFAFRGIAPRRSDGSAELGRHRARGVARMARTRRAAIAELLPEVPA